ncbi:MAG: PilZ domain-containing protein [Sphingobium sp.]
MPFGAPCLIVGRQERRHDALATTVFTIGKATIGGRALPCMVRDISDGGMRIRMQNPPHLGERVLIEMRGLEPRFARTRWVLADEAGLAFEQRCNLPKIFAIRSNRPSKASRQPRFDLRRMAMLLIDGQAQVVEVVDISVGGARLALGGQIARGSVCTLTLGGFLPQPDLLGEICWVDDRQCGLRFTVPLSSTALACALTSDLDI